MAFPSFEGLAAWLDEEAQEIPEPFYEGLNLGIVLLPDTMYAEEGEGDLLILGEYITDITGSQIAIYYGSFKELFAGEKDDVIRAELRETLRHEFVHHMENRAGEHALDDEDEKELRAYLQARERKDYNAD